MCGCFFPGCGVFCLGKKHPPGVFYLVKKHPGGVFCLGKKQAPGVFLLLCFLPTTPAMCMLVVDVVWTYLSVVVGFFVLVFWFFFVWYHAI